MRFMCVWVAAAGLPGDLVPVRAGGGGGAPQGPDEGQDQGLPLRSARSGTGPKATSVKMAIYAPLIYTTPPVR
jgi:hypothetical protein